MEFDEFVRGWQKQTGNVPVQKTPMQVQQLQSLQALIEQHDKIIEGNNANLEIHQKFRADYVTLRDRLRKIADKLEYEALVPLGPKVLVHGKIIHTNEITCLLGDNWFVECTAKKAVEIVGHRIKKCDEMIQKLKKEGELLASWKTETERQLGESLEDGGAEIVEEYDEEREKRWWEAHRESVKRYHQELAKERKENPNAVSEDLEQVMEAWNRLDELELEESMNYTDEHYLFKRPMTPPKKVIPDKTDHSTASNSRKPNPKPKISFAEEIKSEGPDPDVASPTKPENPIAQMKIIERTPGAESPLNSNTEEIQKSAPKRISKFKQSRSSGLE